jgi:integrase
MNDGGRVFATDRELHFLDGDGKTTRTAPNGGTATFYTGPIKSGGLSEAINERPTVATRSGDDAILETYLDFKDAHKYVRRGAEDTWATFKSLTGGKPLVKCGWDDGRKLVECYAAKGLKSASIHKRLVRLNAAVRHAIKTGKLPATMINPFSAVVPKVGKDATQKVRLTEAEIAICRQKLHLLKPEDQLLFRFLCSTGARLGEAFQVVDEETAEGTNIRFCEVGTKTETSHRRIPFPDCLIPTMSTLRAKTTSSKLAVMASPSKHGQQRRSAACGSDDRHVETQSQSS